MVRVYSTAELDAMDDVTKRIMNAMNAAPNYDLLVSIMSAHVQRMICDQALQGADAHQLLEDFHAACTAKVKWWTDMRDGKSVA